MKQIAPLGSDNRRPREAADAGHTLAAYRLFTFQRAQERAKCTHVLPNGQEEEYTTTILPRQANIECIIAFFSPSSRFQLAPRHSLLQPQEKDVQD